MKKRLISAITAAVTAFASLPAIGYAAQDMPEPVLRYTFDGEAELADENGENALTLYGGASVTEDGNIGKALLLDGVDGYALLPSDIISDSMTITAWVNITKFTTWGRVFDLGTDSNNNFFFAPYSGGAARVEIKSPSVTDTMDCAQETVRDWVHYAVTVDNGTVSYYRNGLLVQSKSGIQNLSQVKDELNYIGKSHYDGDAYLAAAVDDFRIYDSALDRDEVCAVMSEGEINPEILLDTYSIENEQIVTGDKIDLPQYDALIWAEKDNLGLIDTETGEVKHNETAETVTITANIGDVSREYTLYVTGKNETPYTVNIDASDRGKDISDIMWGLFFEDINSAADGGLYAELVQNRSFEIEDNEHLYSWETDGDVSVNTENPIHENNPTYITLGAGASVTNDGFQGMSVTAGEKYNFSMYVNGAGEFPVTVGGAEVSVKSEGDGWQKAEAEITPTETSSVAELVVKNTADSADVDMISLIPEDTYKGHGLRKDLMEALEEMHPSFLRFPGGCAVEGQTMETAWNWKDTIGDVSERKEMINIWNPSATEPYMMTYGLGFYEYFQMCEDLGMEPVPILNCGMACQVRSGSSQDEEYLVPMDDLQPYIDDALDLIAFANGTDTSNEWVQKRIEMGHKEPFNLKYIGIGNEQYDEIYFERYAEFAKQIHEQYPDINLITTSGTASSGTSNDLAWNWANENTELADLMDEHYYETEDWFRQHVYRYDSYRRDTNTKVFLGEYASKGNTWYNALSEAAYMTGLERNADVVRMASYAPMFAKYGNVQWSAANMIWFTNDDYMLTPNYYVQSLFSNNRGDYSLSTEVELNGIEKDDAFHGGFAVASWGTHNEFSDITVETADSEYKIELDSSASLEEQGFETSNGEWSINEDGSIVQTSDQTGCVCFYASPDMNNYTLSLKAKKTAGGEGFQIGVAAEDALNYYRVNIGGWSNTTAKVQHIVDGVSAETGNVAEQSYVGSMHIEDDEWYDIRVEVTDYEIKAYMNGEFICSYVKPKEYGPVYASSVYDEESGEVIVKLVNTMDSAVDTGINIDGMSVTSSEAKVTVMSGDTALENSLENKNSIVPVEEEITNAADSFTYNAPANSLSIIHLSAADKSANHTPYISGYEDGTFKPDGNITRAEAATIISKIAGIDETAEYENVFEDVSKNAWYANYVNFMAENEYISGYGGTVFKPENNITRAEFCVILCNYLGVEPIDGESKFTDVSESFWARGYINAMSDKGYVSGYTSGAFVPDGTITRAEAVTMLNRALGRDDFSVEENPFSDLSPSHWAYAQILEAAAEH
ncbi:MAG: S-layer homology domain-containing protein [Oscillospiraceae bacterium]|nr:S-layer homology domain-containing protein [Oscillospiraceae bacterium]